MSWIDSTVREFGQSVGIESLRLGEDGIVAFEMEEGAELSILCPPGDNAGDIVVTMRSRFERDGEAARLALRLCHFRACGPWQVQAWGAAGEITLAMRVPRRSFVLNSLEEAVDGLFDLCDAVRRGETAR
jgi:type III secretion system chaperone SycN